MIFSEQTRTEKLSKSSFQMGQDTINVLKYIVKKWLIYSLGSKLQTGLQGQFILRLELQVQLHAATYF